MIKCAKSNYSGEYFVRYDRLIKQHSKLFAKFLEKCGIILQYTMPRRPNINGANERQNRILKDMVKGMISHTTLPNLFQGKALKTAA